MDNLRRTRWLNQTVLGIGLASLLSDWSHEIATAIMPAFLATLGAAAAWLGVIEGVSDGLASFAKMGSGYFTDQLRRRKPIAIVGYLLTATGTACIGLATQAWHILLCRGGAWLGRGVRTPVRKALLAGAVTPATYGRAFGFERMMDTCGAIIGPITAMLLLVAFRNNFSRVLLVTLVPGVLAAVAIALFVKEQERVRVKWISFRARLAALPVSFRHFLVAVGLFGAGDFAHTLLILLATQKLTPQLGPAKAASVAVIALRIAQCFVCRLRVCCRLVGGSFRETRGLGRRVCARRSDRRRAGVCSHEPAGVGAGFCHGGTLRGNGRSCGRCVRSRVGRQGTSWHGFWHAGDGQRYRRFPIEHCGRCAVDADRVDGSGICLQSRAVIGRGMVSLEVALGRAYEPKDGANAGNPVGRTVSSPPFHGSQSIHTGSTGSPFSASFLLPHCPIALSGALGTGRPTPHPSRATEKLRQGLSMTIRVAVLRVNLCPFVA